VVPVEMPAVSLRLAAAEDKRRRRAVRDLRAQWVRDGRDPAAFPVDDIQGLL
jgi:hypothetical protein